MKEYFSHSAYNRWFRQYKITLDQIRLEFETLRFRVETIPFPDHTRSLLEEEIDEIDITIEQIIPRNFMPGEKPLETREIFVENAKVILNFFLRLFQSAFSFDSIYEQERRNILRKYKDSNIKGKLSNLKRHIDEAIVEQMKTFSENQASQLALKLDNEVPKSELSKTKEAAG